MPFADQPIEQLDRVRLPWAPGRDRVIRGRRSQRASSRPGKRAVPSYLRRQIDVQIAFVRVSERDCRADTALMGCSNDTALHQRASHSTLALPRRGIPRFRYMRSTTPMPTSPRPRRICRAVNAVSPSRLSRVGAFGVEHGALRVEAVERARQLVDVLADRGGAGWSRPPGRRRRRSAARCLPRVCSAGASSDDRRARCRRVHVDAALGEDRGAACIRILQGTARQLPWNEIILSQSNW